MGGSAWLPTVTIEETYFQKLAEKFFSYLLNQNWDTNLNESMTGEFGEIHLSLDQSSLSLELILALQTPSGLARERRAEWIRGGSALNVYSQQQCSATRLP